MYVLNTLLPIFIIIFLGTALRSFKFASEEFFQYSNRMVYWIGLPCLLFVKISQVNLQGNRALPISLILIGAMFVCMLIAYLLSWLLHIPSRSTGAFVQGAMRGNLYYIGLPVVLFSLATHGSPQLASIEALAVLAIAPMILVYNATSVLVLIKGSRQGRRKSRRWISQLVISIFSNPLLIACILGIIYSLTGWPLPYFLNRSCSTIGQMALPLALLGIGATLTQESWKNRLKLSFIAALIKVIIAPLFGYIVASLIPLSPIELRITLLYLACPTAVASYVMAEQMNGDDRLASNIVIISTLLSLPALATVLLLT